jgi:hypothetical protein
MAKAALPATAGSRRPSYGQRQGLLQNGGSAMGRKVKPVYFNEATEEHLLEYAGKQRNFSAWVKRQIERRISEEQKGIDPEMVAMVERLVEKKLAGRTITAPDQGTQEAAIDIAGIIVDFY